MNILLDAMGGDNAPDANIKGAIKAITQIKADVTLIGKEDIAKKYLQQLAEKYQMKKDEFLKAFGGIEMIKYDLEMRGAIDVLKGE